MVWTKGVETCDLQFLIFLSNEFCNNILRVSWAAIRASTFSMFNTVLHVRADTVSVQHSL
jgi:hypothetical protein